MARDEAADGLPPVTSSQLRPLLMLAPLTSGYLHLILLRTSPDPGATSARRPYPPLLVQSSRWKAFPSIQAVRKGAVAESRTFVPPHSTIRGRGYKGRYHHLPPGELRRALPMRPGAHVPLSPKASGHDKKATRF